MSIENEGYGKLVSHGEPAEAPSQSQVDRRASELARIEGRDQPTSEDRARALKEIQGLGSRRSERFADVPEDGLARDPSEPTQRGATRKPRINEEEENQAAETAALEGVEEAEHEQMLQARRQQEEEE